MKRGLLSIPSRARRAFSLVELMVVIGVIAVLVGIVLVVGGTLAENTNITRTRNFMQVLDGALTEWQNRADRALTWGVDGLPFAQSRYDMQADAPHVYLITQMLDVVGRSGDVKSILSQIDERHLVQYNNAQATAPPWLRNVSASEPDPAANQWVTQWQSGAYNGRLTVLDAWDRPIRVVHPGRLWDAKPPWNDTIASSGPPDEDGTVRTVYENIYGVCRNRRPLFVSAGPDGEFGNLQLNLLPGNRNTALSALADDNIYSYEVEGR